MFTFKKPKLLKMLSKITLKQKAGLYSQIGIIIHPDNRKITQHSGKHTHYPGKPLTVKTEYGDGN